MGAFHSTTSKKKVNKKAAQLEKCFWCQKTGHRIADCPERKAGKPRAKKPSSTFPGDGIEEEVTGTQPMAPPRGLFSLSASMQK